MRQYQWLLFDADGTLFDYDRAESAALKRTFQLMGAGFEPGYLTTYQGINRALWQAVEQGKLAPGVVKVRRFDLLLQSLGLAHSPSAFSARYLQCLAECSELVEGAAETLEGLSGKYRMAILTNGLQVVQRGRLERSLIRRHIAEIIISEEIGFAKPAREFFNVALERLGNPPRRAVLMIGDSWDSDILGATQSGLDACWYNPQRKPRPGRGTITREIVSLRELVHWLG